MAYSCCSWTFLVVARLLMLSVVMATSATPDDGLYMSRCRQDLGMHSRQIPDDAISASSSFDEKNVGPLNARIRTERNGGAWCPKTQIAREVYEFLEVDLSQLKIVTLVETQGRFGNGQGQEFATNYRLEYQRADDGRWFRYKNHNGSEILKGNANTYIAEVRELRPPIIARRIRFVPHSNYQRTVCMRVELFGCESKGRQLRRNF